MSSKTHQTTRPRGVFERPAGSGVWWVNYYVSGKQRREKVGTKSAAVALYRKRKTQILEKKKLPELGRKEVTLGDLIDLALEFTENHKDRAGYVTKAKIVREAMGSRAAREILPRDIEAFLRSHCTTPATHNRYKSFFSLCFRQGLRNDKVDRNPARDVATRREPSGRIRFLSQDEYYAVLASIEALCPERRAEFVFSVLTGMRLSEQYTLTWNQVDVVAGRAFLTETKNGSDRTVHLNVDVRAVLRAMPKGKRKELVFAHTVANFDNSLWFEPVLERAEVTGYLWHCNRHTFCSWLAMAGATIKEIQEAAGHKSITMSARYAHLSDAHKQSVVERIASGPNMSSRLSPDTDRELRRAA